SAARRTRSASCKVKNSCTITRTCAGERRARNWSLSSGGRWICSRAGRRSMTPSALRSAGSIGSSSDGTASSAAAMTLRSARGWDLAAQQHRRVDVPAEVRDARGVAAVFVAVWEVPEQIVDGGQLVLFEEFGPAGANAREKTDGGVGGDCHGRIL